MLGDDVLGHAPELQQPLTIRAPEPSDGLAVTALIAACPPLDRNSAYCNLLQCSDFADTCVVAERDGALLGWVSAYLAPADPGRLFLWQIAIAPAARGQGLGMRMLDALVRRPACRGADRLTTTITDENGASWALFTRFAERIGATLTHSPHFDEDRHFGGAHATEHLVTIAPLTPSSLPAS